MINNQFIFNLHQTDKTSIFIFRHLVHNYFPLTVPVLNMVDRFTSQVNYSNKSKERPENNEPEYPPKDTNALFACLDNLKILAIHD